MPRQAPMIIRVWRAFFHSGFLKAGTPLEMASTPVMAAPPEAKACRIRNDADGAGGLQRGRIGRRTTCDKPPPNSAL